MKEYSKFDEEGVPSHDSNGVEIKKEIRNKLKKEFKKHDEAHKKWLEKNTKKEELNEN